MYRILAGILNIGNIEFAAISSQHQTDKSEVPNAEALENGNCLMSVHCVAKIHVSFTLVLSQDAVKYRVAVAGLCTDFGYFHQLGFPKGCLVDHDNSFYKLQINAPQKRILWQVTLGSGVNTGYF